MILTRNQWFIPPKRARIYSTQQLAAIKEKKPDFQPPSSARTGSKLIAEILGHKQSQGQNNPFPQRNQFILTK